jgi:5'/3'-nucleotidase SurE
LILFGFSLIDKIFCWYNSWLFRFLQFNGYYGKNKKQILLSNDDGIDSPGLWAAAEALSELGYVTVAAPRDHMSATGRGHQRGSDGSITKKVLNIRGQTGTVCHRRFTLADGLAWLDRTGCRKNPIW